jgi:hypothetical protein
MTDDEPRMPPCSICGGEHWEEDHDEAVITPFLAALFDEGKTADQESPKP